MIRKYNATQIALAVLNFGLGIVAYAITYLFFSVAAYSVIDGFGLDHLSPYAVPAALVALLLVSLFGYRAWREGEGHYEFARSGFYTNFGEENGGAAVTEFYVRRITGPAHFMVQIALAGPLQLMKAVGRLQSLLPDDRNLEQTLGSLLKEIQAVGRWHDIASYEGRQDQVLMLIQMGHIDFNPKNGRLKAA